MDKFYLCTSTLCEKNRVNRICGADKLLSIDGTRWWSRKQLGQTFMTGLWQGLMWLKCDNFQTVMLLHIQLPISVPLCRRQRSHVRISDDLLFSMCVFFFFFSDAHVVGKSPEVNVYHNITDLDRYTRTRMPAICKTARRKYFKCTHLWNHKTYNGESHLTS